MAPAPQIRFEEHCQKSVQGLRGALLELYRVVGADPTRPQDVSRQYRLNKNLTWKVARIMSAEDSFEAAPLIPGPGGLEILLEAMSKAGAPAGALDRVRSAASEFDRMIEIHTGDRNTLELALDSGGSARPMEMSRKLAFRGNSGIWGIQAGVRVTAHFLAPNADDPSMLDLAMFAGLTRIRRLRPVERWPVFQVREYNDDGSAVRRERRRAVEPSASDAPGHPWLMRSMCSGAMPPMHTTQRGDTTLYELGEGPVGLTGECSCFFGFTDTAEVPRHRDAANRYGEFVSSVSVPVEALQFDLFVHESMREAMSPSVSMYGTVGGSIDGVGSMRLPMRETLQDLGLGAMVDTPAVPRYGEGVSAVIARMGRKPGEFRCLRLLVEHPPMSSRVGLRYELPERGLG
ncbi:MAG: hypothetical protein IBJ10_11080 [Phycisphaerales bacterium]|nr:hypothetical protein [Phycisphaerales bacterium]